MARRLRHVERDDNAEQDYNLNRPLQAQARARNAGVRFPTERELLLDLDSPEALVVFDERYQLLQELCPGVVREIRKSRTVGHYHVSVMFPSRTDAFTPVERLAYEMALGSDSKRGLFGLYRIEDQRSHESSILFRYAHTHTCATEEEADDDDLPF